MNDIIEDYNIINKNEMSELLLNVPFYGAHPTTTEKFPMYSHIMVKRPTNFLDFEQNTDFTVYSDFYNYFKTLVDVFCFKYCIKYKNIIRANINNTFYVNTKHSFVDPHLDFNKPHTVILMYLSKVSSHSSTLIFEKTQNFDGNDISMYDLDIFDEREFKIKKEIIPEFGKIVAFDGKYYHSNRVPLPGENRIVCVFNLLT